jgi:LuxR family maltose regulon positive regulatory protein
MAVDSHEAAVPAPELVQLLLDAKFAVPRPRPGVVSRTGLVKAARSGDRRLVGVTAPAGYGKSIFLAQWAAAEERPVAWVSLDRFDDDPAKLLVSLASGYRRAGLGSPDLVAAMGGPGVSVLGRAAPRLASEFRASAAPFVLMLDDLHVLQSPACHDVLSLLIAAIPHGSQLAAASRSEQPRLPRLRAAGDVLEFGPADLALDAAGAQQIFALKQVSLTPEQAAAVAGRTEGWPAGLYLAAVIAKQSRGQAPAVTEDDPYVADSLYREAVVEQPEDRLRFVRRTAVLDQLSGPLCDAVLGSSGAAGQLRRMEATSLFVIALDGRREWYRYHDLFREFLLGELRRTEPDVIDTLHQRAADWYEANGSPALALEHLLHTTDWERSTRLASKLYHSTFEAGQVTTVQRWLRVIGDANIERCPPLAVGSCWIAILTGDTAGALRWAAFVETASFDGVPADGTASFESARAMLRAGMCPAGPEAMMADAAFVVAQEPERSEWRSTALWLFAEAHLLRGNLDQASSLYAEASTAAATSGHAEGVVSNESQLAGLSMDRGDWQEAADRLERALATIDQSWMHDYVRSLPAFAGAARLSLHRGDLNETYRQLARAMRARPSATYLLPIDAVRARLQLAKVYLALADLATARQVLREIDDILKHRPALGTLVDEVGELRGVLASTSTAGPVGRLPLTPAELRLLPYLQTPLTTDGIAERLFVSIHTVKSEMSSIYRKLGVSSRSKAVQKATAIGLLGE